MVQNWVTTVPLRCKPIVQKVTLTRKTNVSTPHCTPYVLIFYMKKSTEHVMLTKGLKNKDTRK